jgi:hypothetical protein
VEKPGRSQTIRGAVGSERFHLFKQFNNSDGGIEGRGNPSVKGAAGTRSAFYTSLSPPPPNVLKQSHIIDIFERAAPSAVAPLTDAEIGCGCGI